MDATDVVAAQLKAKPLEAAPRTRSVFLSKPRFGLIDNSVWAAKVVGAGYLAAAILSAMAFASSGGTPIEGGGHVELTWFDIQLGYLLCALVLYPLLALLRPVFSHRLAGSFAFGLLTAVAFITFAIFVKGELTQGLVEGAIYLIPWGALAGYIFLRWIVSYASPESDYPG